MVDTYPEGDAKRACGGTPEEAGKMVNTRSGRSTKNPRKSPQGETVSLNTKSAPPTSAQPGVAEPAEANVEHAHGDRRRFRRLRRPLLSSSVLRIGNNYYELRKNSTDHVTLEIESWGRNLPSIFFS